MSTRTRSSRLRWSAARRLTEPRVIRLLKACDFAKYLVDQGLEWLAWQPSIAEPIADAEKVAAASSGTWLLQGVSWLP
jgi:hypothetical protein